MSVEPADINTGIVFVRTDVKSNNIIKAVIENTFDSNLCTKIKNKHDISVSTIEHLMAALSALSIDNAIIKINNSELPALDGSSYEYVKKIIRSENFFAISPIVFLFSLSRSPPHPNNVIILPLEISLIELRT